MINSQGIALGRRNKDIVKIKGKFYSQLKLYYLNLTRPKVIFAQEDE